MSETYLMTQLASATTPDDRSITLTQTATHVFTVHVETVADDLRDTYTARGPGAQLRAQKFFEAAKSTRRLGVEDTEEAIFFSVNTDQANHDMDNTTAGTAAIGLTVRELATLIGALRFYNVNWRLPSWLDIVTDNWGNVYALDNRDVDPLSDRLKKIWSEL